MFLESYSDAIYQLCQQYKVKTLYAFGSVLTSRFSKKSDIDFVVDIDSVEPYEYADNYFNLKLSPLKVA
jgi:predicted nucleotidyltransferase